MLFRSFFDNKEFERRFKFHSAAKSVHHGFVGGLLEHTLGVTKNCDYFAKMYPVLNRDLLLTAAIFHDIGKLKELSTKAIPQGRIHLFLSAFIFRIMSCLFSYSYTNLLSFHSLTYHLYNLL